jgi:hypothetical protein
VIKGQAHQLLHGYRNGHAQIEASIRLDERDSDLVTRLSDLSGNLSSGVKFNSYLTAYPLPSRKYYVLARTWLDPDAPRAGCVLTHTLLVPLDYWTTAANLRSLDHLFHNPRSNAPHDFNSPVNLSSKSRLTSDEVEIDVSSSEVFVFRYFGRGLRPIIWFDTDQAEVLLWRLLEHLWPRLRSIFSSCTYSLQPRTLEDGPFDLLFAPNTVYSRFTKLSAEHLIEAGAKDSIPDSDEPWCQQLARDFFSSTPNSPLKEKELSLWNELAEDPTSVRKLSLIHELRLQSFHSPVAGVGAIDVVESLAREPESALGLKRQIFNDAIASAAGAQPPADALTSLRLIDDRLRRESFRNVAEEFDKRLSAAAAQVAAKYPDVALEGSATWLNESVAGDKRPFVEGVMAGLARLAHDNPSSLTTLRSYPAVAAELFRLVPSFGATYLQLGGDTARHVLSGWLSSTRDLDALKTVRTSVLSSGQHITDPELLPALLRDIGPQEVDKILDLLAKANTDFSAETVRHAISDRLSSTYPELVRRWAAGLPVWSAGISEIAASTFSQSFGDFKRLLGADEFNRKQTTEVLVAKLKTLLIGGFPYWLREQISQDVRVIDILMSGSLENLDEIEPIISRITSEVPELPLADSNVDSVLRFTPSKIFPRLRDSAMRSLVGRYIREGTYADKLREFMNYPDMIPWFRTVIGSQVSALLVHACSSGPEAIARAWEWVSDAPPELYERSPSILPELCDSLLSCARRSFPAGAEMSFTKVLRRTKYDSDEFTRQVLCGKFLRFSLDNIRLPLGSVAAESFAEVYAIAVKDTRAPSFLASLFGSYDWDKAKDLRVTIVDTFMRSTWSPGDLAIAANNAGILRKIFKRLHRIQTGDRYAASMYQDLIGRHDRTLRSLADDLKALLDSPDFYEDWD